jgi:integrase
MPDRYRSLVLLAAFGSLRWGEVSALRRRDIAEDGSWVRVDRAFVELPRKGLVAGPPKSRAGIREVIIPAAIRADLVRHLNGYVDDDSAALLFTGERSGKAVRRPNFAQRVKWTKVVADLGLQGLHFHDLRHAGNIWASKSGTSTADLMARMGHDDVRAALIYQRSTREADELIAKRLSKLVDQHRNKGKQPKSKRRKKPPEDGAAGVPASER